VVTRKLIDRLGLGASFFKSTPSEVDDVSFHGGPPLPPVPQCTRCGWKNPNGKSYQSAQLQRKSSSDKVGAHPAAGQVPALR
jgi:hypothetical protein